MFFCRRVSASETGMSGSVPLFSLSNSLLFSPLALGNLQLHNRLVCASLCSGLGREDGRFGEELAEHYRAIARGGAGLIVTEALCPLRPTLAGPHLALYEDAFIPDLHGCLAEVHVAGSSVLVMLDQPVETAALRGVDLAELGAAFVTAAWRAQAAGAHGIMLSTCDGGPFAQLLSPLHNRRDDQHGAGLEGRLWLLLHVIEGLSRWLGREFVLGVRLLVEEFTPGGMTLQDARVVAQRLVGAGVGLLEIGVRWDAGVPLAQFPGWLLPLAAAVREVVDVPVLVGGQLDEAKLAESALAEGSADLIDVAERLWAEPEWPQRARLVLDL
jgi:NADPH2 dehydrogenase